MAKERVSILERVPAGGLERHGAGWSGDAQESPAHPRPGATR